MGFKRRTPDHPDFVQRLSEDTAFDAFNQAFMDGFDPVTGKECTFNDLLAVPNAGEWLPQIIETILREPIEVPIILTNLLDRIPVQRGTKTVTMSLGTLTAADIGENEAYPEKEINIAPGTMTAAVGKSGLRFKFTDEILDRSQFDIVRYHLMEANKALARHKEYKVANFMLEMGVRVFDNELPTTSVKGVTTGRDRSGSANGSITWDDLFDMFGVVINNGFMPNMIIMHPLTWTMWMKDPVLRTFAINAGGGSWWGSYQGNPAAKGPTPSRAHVSGGQNIMPGGNAMAATASSYLDYPQFMQASPVMPQHFLPYPITTVVTPYVFYDTTSNLTDIIVCDSRELGALLVEEEPTIKRRELFEYDLQEIKIRERYAMMIYEEGLGIATARNIKVIPNEIVLPAQSTFDTSTMPTITATVPVM